MRGVFTDGAAPWAVLLVGFVVGVVDVRVLCAGFFLFSENVLYNMYLFYAV